MSAQTFLNDYKAYFVDHELSEYDEGRILAMFQEHSQRKEVIPIEKIIVKHVIKNVPKSTGHIKYIYVDPNSGLKYRKMVDVPNYQTFIDSAIKDACELWCVPVEKVMGKRCKERQLVNCRMFIAMKLSDYGLGCVEITKVFKNYRDHSGIIHLIKNGKNLLDANTQPFTTLWKLYNRNEIAINQEENMPQVRDEEAGNGILHTQGTPEAWNSDISL